MSKISYRILLVDDEAAILSSLKRVLRSQPLEILTASNGLEALALLENQPVDILLTDLNMPQMDGVALCAEVAQKYPEIIRIMLTAHAEFSHIFSAVNEGKVWGYLQKPWDNQQLVILIQQALRDQQILVERSVLRKTLDRYQKVRRPEFAGFIGDSVAMQFVYSAIERSAPSQASVFITGESGTGKEVAASAIHQLSKRKDGPFIALNCAAIPGELMESEIFGHVKGAFSGAVSNRDGAATLADGGTLFLDELGEMDMSLQAKLLRFIQTGTFQKVGSSKTEQVSIRFVCATNRDPMQAIENKKLREDLYYRLNVISIDLPPLNEREDDAVLLAMHFLAMYGELEEKRFTGFTADAEQLLRNYTWPGNVRQLQNLIHSCVIMGDGPLMEADLIAQQLKIRDTSSNTATSSDSLSVPQNVMPPADISSQSGPTIESLALTERRAVENALSYYQDNVVQAASALGVSPSTLYRKMQAWQTDKQ